MQNSERGISTLMIVVIIAILLGGIYMFLRTSAENAANREQKANTQMENATPQ